MNKLYVPGLIVALALSLVNCTKSGTNQPPQVNDTSGYKLELLQGAGQTDTIGDTLKTELIFKATYNADTLDKGYIRFETIDCDNNTYTIERAVGRAEYYQLFVNYRWRLNGITGTQRLLAILLDKNKIPRDSADVTATALSPSAGWHSSGCSQPNTFAVSFCSLSSGRIFTAYYGTGFPYYSDDEGASWYVLTTFPEQLEIKKIVSTQQDEIFLAANGKGVYYSNDGGATWQKRSNGLPSSTAFWGDLQYTKSGKLFSLTNNGVFKSDDKGLHWHKAMGGLSYYTGFWNAASTTDSTLYAIEGYQLVRSTDGGENWVPVYQISGSNVNCLFIDDNDDLYAAAATTVGFHYALMLSKDDGATWSEVYVPYSPFSSNNTMSQMTKQNGYYYFCLTDLSILMKTVDFINVDQACTLSVDNFPITSFAYLTLPDNHLVISNEALGIFYYIP